MTSRQPLPLRPPVDMRAAHAVLQTLEAEYLKAHRRKHTIDLALSSQSQPFYDEKGRVRMGRETIGVTAVYDAKDAAHLTQLSWFTDRARGLN